MAGEVIAVMTLSHFFKAGNKTIIEMLLSTLYRVKGYSPPQFKPETIFLEKIIQYGSIEAFSQRFSSLFSKLPKAFVTAQLTQIVRGRLEIRPKGVDI